MEAKIAALQYHFGIEEVLDTHFQVRVVEEFFMVGCFPFTTNQWDRYEFCTFGIQRFSLSILGEMEKNDIIHVSTKQPRN